MNKSTHQQDLMIHTAQNQESTIQKMGESNWKFKLAKNLELIRLGQETGAVGDGTTAYRLDVSGSGADAYLPLIDLRKVFGLQWGLKLQKERNDRLSFVINDDLSAGLDVFNIRAFGMRI